MGVSVGSLIVEPPDPTPGRPEGWFFFVHAFPPLVPGGPHFVCLTGGHMPGLPEVQEFGTLGRSVMAELIIGASGAVAFALLLRLVRTRGLKVTWWQWGLTFLGLLYTVFVVEVVVSFLQEGTPKGAAVMGTLMGFVAVVWAVLLGRFVFRRAGGLPGPGSAEIKGGSHA